MLGINDIRYTLDGTAPTMSSAAYSQPVRFKAPVNLYAQAFRNGKPIGFSLKRFSPQVLVIAVGLPSRTLLMKAMAVAEIMLWSTTSLQPHEAMIPIGRAS